MFLSVLLGAVLYGMIQFAWYAPFGFGHLWLAAHQSSPKEALQDVRNQGMLLGVVQGVLLPALLMSMALHALYAVLGRFGRRFFFVATLMLGIVTTAKKYRAWKETDQATRLSWCLSDGALLLSLFVLAVFVVLMQDRLY